jgi:hypothetical protein
VCDRSDLEITTSFATSSGDGNWFLYDNNPETYVEHKKLADGSFNFAGGLPVLAEFQVGRYREIITVFLDLKISNSVLTLIERIEWDLVVEEGLCKDSRESISFTTNNGFKQAESSTTYLTGTYRNYWALNDLSL